MLPDRATKENLKKGGESLNKLKQPIVTAAAITGIVGVSTMGVSLTANAQANNGGTLADKIAKQFDLDKNDVQTVFDEDRAEHEAEKQQKLEKKLNKAVSDGEITSTQKDQITAKLKEIKSFLDSLKGKTPPEREAALKAKRAELKKWAKDNKIPEELLPHYGMRHGFKRP